MSKVKLIAKWNADPASKVVPTVKLRVVKKRSLDENVIEQVHERVVSLESLGKDVWENILSKLMTWKDAKALCLVSKSVNAFISPIMGAFAVDMFAPLRNAQFKRFGKIVLDNEQCAQARKFWDHLRLDAFSTRTEAKRAFSLTSDAFDAFCLPGIRPYGGGQQVFFSVDIYLACLKKYGTFDNFLTKIKTPQQRKLVHKKAKKAKKVKCAKRKGLVDEALANQGFRTFDEIAVRLGGLGKKHHCAAFNAVHDFTRGLFSHKSGVENLDALLRELHELTANLTGRHHPDVMLFLKPFMFWPSPEDLLFASDADN